MSDNTDPTGPRILDYGPARLIGLGRVCKTSEDCIKVWADAHGSMEEMGGAQGPYFALCRCAPGAEAGAFEYIAAMPAPDGVSVPEGMAEFVVPAGVYAEFPVTGLSDIGRVWGYTGEWLSAHPEWQGFCDGNPDRCGCVDHLSFELYPPGFDESKGLSIYVPLRPSS